MGMFDYVVVLDEVLHCPHGHPVGGFQTKSFDDPSMDTYLVDGPYVHLVERGSDDGGAQAAARWQLEGDEAVYRRWHAVSLVGSPGDIVFYTTCEACAPVLVRSDHATAWGDLVTERRVWVEFRATFGTDRPRRIERISGTREDLVAGLREEGLRVLGDDEPLAIAHHEIRAARVAGARKRLRR